MIMDNEAVKKAAKEAVGTTTSIISYKKSSYKES